ncbi:MAG: hypothetical protein QXG65_00440 [Thermoplasmata archaeon]
MRTGLVIVGMAIALVGAAIFLTIVLAPPTAVHTTTTFQTQEPWADGNNSTTGDPAFFPGSGTGSLKLVWATFGGAVINASFYDVKDCPLYINGSCRGPPTYTWTGLPGGLFVSNTSLACPCYLILTNPTPHRVTVLAVLLETYQAPSPALGTLAYIAVISGSLILLSIGALSTFFGLFLRSSIYDPHARTGIPEIDEIEDEPDGPPSGGGPRWPPT